MSNFSFNGIRKNYCDYMDYDAGWGQSRDLEINEVRGRPGGVLSNIKESPREIEVNVLVDATYNTQTLYELADDFISWLSTNEPKELIFDREPDKVYYAILSSRIDTEEFVTFGKATVKFTCVDPYKYSVKTFENTAISDQVSIANTGTADAPIVIEARALKNANYFMISKNDEDYFMIGDDDINQPLKDYSPSLLLTELETLTGWTKIADGSVQDNYGGGRTGGTLSVDTNIDRIKLTEPATGTGWVGGMYKKTFGRAATDYQTMVKFQVNQRNAGSNRATQYLYDTDNRLLMSITYTNSNASQKIGYIYVTLFNQAGEQKVIYKKQNIPALYKVQDLIIYVKIRKIGNEFHIKTWKYDERANTQRITPLDKEEKLYTDTGGFYQRNISNISLYIAKHTTGAYMPVYILGSFTRELLSKPIGSRDMIIKTGDEIVIDTAAKNILVNEEPFLSEKTFGSDFFNVDKGVSELFIYPTGVFDTRIIWRDRYL